MKRLLYWISWGIVVVVLLGVWVGLEAGSFDELFKVVIGQEPSRSMIRYFVGGVSVIIILLFLAAKGTLHEDHYQLGKKKED